MLQWIKDNKWILGGLVFAGPYVILAFTYLMAVAADPEFHTKLWSEILTRETYEWHDQQHRLLTDLDRRVKILEAKEENE